MRWFKLLLVLSATWVFAPMVQAHHSVAAFDTTKTIEIVGTVKEVWWANPHVRIYLEVPGADGAKSVVWVTHSASPNLLRRGGWVRSTVKVGDHVSIWGNPKKDGSKMMFIRKVKLPSGKMLDRFGYMNDK